MTGSDRTGPESKGSQTGRKNGKCKANSSYPENRIDEVESSTRSILGRCMSKRIRQLQGAGNESERGGRLGRRKGRGGR